MYKDPDKQREWHSNYEKNNYKKYRIRLRLVEDKEIIEHLQAQDNINAYIKALVIEDMKNIR